MLVTHTQAAVIDSLSRSQRERLVAEGRYPAPVRLSERRIAFAREEIEDWVRARIRARDRARELAPELAPVVAATAPEPVRKARVVRVPTKQTVVTR